MGVEVKQTLERGFDISMAMKEIRKLTVNSLREITSGTKDSKSGEKSDVKQSAKEETEVKELVPEALIVKLNNSVAETDPLFIIHPIEGE